MAKRAGSAAAAAAGVEALQFKSPAEFFAEHQAIAGFDNVRARRRVAPRARCRCRGRSHTRCGRPIGLRAATRTAQAGKALYTTIREFVENSLDVRGRRLRAHPRSQRIPVRTPTHARDWASRPSNRPAGVRERRPPA